MCMMFGRTYKILMRPYNIESRLIESVYSFPLKKHKSCPGMLSIDSQVYRLKEIEKILVSGSLVYETWKYAKCTFT